MITNTRKYSHLYGYSFLAFTLEILKIPYKNEFTNSFAQDF